MSREDAADVTLGILPNGSPGNLHAKYGIPSAMDGAKLIVAGLVRRMDLVKVEDLSTGKACYSASYIGYGMPVKVLTEAMTKPRNENGSMSTMALATARMKLLVRPVVVSAGVELPEVEVPDDVRQRWSKPNDLNLVLVFSGRLLIRGKHCDHRDLPLDSGKLLLNIRRVASRWKDSRWFHKHDGELEVTSCVLRPSEDCKPGSVQVGPESLIVDGDIVTGTPCRVAVVPMALQVFTA
jgi:diacylglycerol kinase family enzyme